MGFGAAGGGRTIFIFELETIYKYNGIVASYFRS